MRVWVWVRMHGSRVLLLLLQVRARNSCQLLLSLQLFSDVITFALDTCTLFAQIAVLSAQTLDVVARFRSHGVKVATKVVQALAVVVLA